MADTSDFAKLVPGFDFLQGLVKNAGAALPSMGQWVAPTLDPQELQKRIDELKTVQFWLEQNARMLGTTVQALEVQRMTLATLETMNVRMADLGEAMKVSPVAAMGAMGAAAAAGSGQASAAPGVVDPMQWWGALTRQFTQLATGAIQDAAGGAPGKAADVAGEAPAETAEAAAGKKTAARKPAARRAATKTHAR